MATLMQASRQWSSRPDDERYLNLNDLHAHNVHQRSISRSAVISTREIEVKPMPGDDAFGMAVIRRNGEHAYNPSYWAMGQLCGLANAPAGYIRTLAAPLAADCLNFGLMKRDVQETQLLLRRNGESTLSAATGPNYGRIWNSDISSALVRNFGNGRDGVFRIPGEFGRQVEITKQNTTLYAGERDMFVFLADESNRIHMRDRREGKSGELSRGFFVWNSEVGSATCGIAMFLFDYVCSNRIVWGARGYKEIKLRHTSGAPDRLIEQVMPVLDSYHHSSAAPVEATIKAAQDAKLQDTVADFLANRRYSNGRIAAIVNAHNNEEGRPMETLWDVVTGITAAAKSITYQDERVAMERDAGKILDMVAVR